LLSPTIISKLAYLIISFIVGVLFYYVTSEAGKVEKKQQLDIIFSLLVNFIIYLWIGKLILNFPRLLNDPIAVLAYPMNSYSFYIATFLLIINLAYLFVIKSENLTVIFRTFLPIFLASLFLYEFIELVIENYSQQRLTFILQLILLLVYLFYHNKHIYSKEIVFSLWIAGKIVLSFILPYTKIFNFMISPYYFIVLFIIFILVYLYNWKRKVA